MTDWVRTTERLPERAPEVEYWVLRYTDTQPVLADYLSDDEWWVQEWDSMLVSGEVEFWAPGIRPEPPEDAGKTPMPERAQRGDWLSRAMEPPAETPEEWQARMDKFLADMRKAVKQITKALKVAD